MSGTESAAALPCSCPETTGGLTGSPGLICGNYNAPGCRKRAEQERFLRDRRTASSERVASTELRRLATILGNMADQYGQPDWSLDEFLEGLRDIAMQLNALARALPSAAPAEATTIDSAMLGRIVLFLLNRGQAINPEVGSLDAAMEAIDSSLRSATRRKAWPLDECVSNALDQLFASRGLHYPQSHSDMRLCLQAVEEYLNSPDRGAEDDR